MLCSSREVRWSGVFFATIYILTSKNFISKENSFISYRQLNLWRARLSSRLLGSRELRATNTNWNHLYWKKINIIETDKILTLLKICNCISVWCYYPTDNIDRPYLNNSAYTKWHHQFVRYEYEQQNAFYNFYESTTLVHHETMNSFEESATGWYWSRVHSEERVRVSFNDRRQQEQHWLLTTASHPAKVNKAYTASTVLTALIGPLQVED